MDLGLATFGGGLLQTAGNIWSARRQENFQERMSSTAYQRAAKDLEAAGLNRVLALGSPATTPGGAVAQFPNVGEAYSAGASAQQNISESKTRETVNDATAQAQIASAKAAVEEAKLKEETARRMRTLLPQEIAESEARLKAAGQAFDIGEIDKRFKKLGLSEQEFKKTLYERLGPLAGELLDKLTPYLNSAVDAGPGMIEEGVGAARSWLTDFIENTVEMFKSDAATLDAKPPGMSYGDWNRREDARKRENARLRYKAIKERNR